LPTPHLISVIDDDELFRVAADSLLRAHGYAVHVFASATEFLQSSQLDRTSCVITDVQMPGINGLQLQLLLRDQGCAVPIIFITAFPDEAVRARAIREGAVCFLTKPSDPSTLISFVEKALAAH
jgi:FixJ family two-component response regulator